MSRRLIFGSRIPCRVDKLSALPVCNGLTASRNCVFLHQRANHENYDFRSRQSPNSLFEKRYKGLILPSNALFGARSLSTITPSRNGVSSADLLPSHLIWTRLSRPFLENRRLYAKGMDKVKSKKSNVIVNEHEIGQLVDVQGLKSQLDGHIAEMKEEFAVTLSIRGAAGHLETMQVEFEGQMYPLQELAQVGRKNPQMAVLNMSSLPDACQAVMKAIQESGMNINPQQEGTTIFVPLPKVTREHRENLAKNAKTLFTKYKVFLQGVQNRYIKEGKRQTGMSEDLIYSVQQQIMKLTDGYIAEAEKLMLAKQKELLDTK